MAQFDMRGQQVTNQYIAGRDMNFGAVQSPEDWVIELEKLKGEFLGARQAGIIGEEEAIDAEYQVTKAIQQSKKVDPDKKSILHHLNTARSFIAGITAASGLVTALTGAMEVVQKLFS